MALIAPADEQRLRDEFAHMTRRVRLVFFSQAIGCDTCRETRRILDELPPLSDRIDIEELNPILDTARAAAYGVDRAPAIAIEYDAGDHETTGPPRFVDSRIRFLGTPGGYEFVSLVKAVLLAGGAGSSLSEASRERLASVERPMTIRVFTTPTCSYCPRAVTLAHEMAMASPHVTAIAIEATEFPDLARRYEVTGVPKTIVDDAVEILGALPEEDFIAQALGN